MYVNGLQFISFTIALFCAFTDSFHNSITTHSGRIRGKTVCSNGICSKAYLGIPYAKPPVGNLRFKKTVPVEPWEETLQAKTLPPGCVQYSKSPFPWLDDFPGLSEDCLYLNIWTPITSNIFNSITSNIFNKKSVMFWIHGGGFRTGSSRIDRYNGQVLAAEGDVIVVSINYRLGAEGFFYSGTEDAPGNMGMWDIAEALKWVKKNIESFGGDKDAITLFGHSAGGIAIGMFCVSPITRGSFKRAILQSGTPAVLNGEDNDKSFKISQSLAETLGCTNEENTLDRDPEAVVECMRNKNASDVAIALADVTAGSPRGYYPRFNDDFLPKNPRQAIAHGDFAPVDVLVGSNNGDGSTLITNPLKNVFGFFGEKNPQINLTFGESIIRYKFKNYPNPDDVVQLYLGNLKENDYEAIRFEVFTAAGDYSIVCPSVYFAESFAKKDVSVYYYFFTHTPSNTPWAPWMLAVHGDEGPFVFGYPLRYPDNYTEAEQAFSRRIMEAWSNFAKTGDPGDREWPMFSRKNPVYKVLNVNTDSTANGVHKYSCDFFRSRFGF